MAYWPVQFWLNFNRRSHNACQGSGAFLPDLKVGVSSPKIKCTKVVFPAPDFPTIETNSPSLISKETKMPCKIIDDPLTAVVRGAGIALENIETLAQVMSRDEEGDVPY